MSSCRSAAREDYRVALGGSAVEHPHDKIVRLLTPPPLIILPTYSMVARTAWALRRVLLPG